MERKEGREVNPGLVACVMPVHDGRAAMASHAARAFDSQTYKNRVLVADFQGDGMGYGSARNLINALAIRTHDPEFICHWDSDDWSAPTRLADQIKFLTSVHELDCTGFKDLIFWDERNPQAPEAWAYSHPDPRYCAGTSMMYYARCWKARPFDTLGYGEDLRWQKTLTRRAAPMMGPTGPLMIARIHEGNNGNAAYNPETMADSMSWRKAPEWQEHCRIRMAV